MGRRSQHRRQNVGDLVRRRFLHRMAAAAQKQGKKKRKPPTPRPSPATGEGSQRKKKGAASTEDAAGSAPMGSVSVSCPTPLSRRGGGAGGGGSCSPELGRGLRFGIIRSRHNHAVRADRLHRRDRDMRLAVQRVADNAGGKKK